LDGGAKDGFADRSVLFISVDCRELVTLSDFGLPVAQVVSRCTCTANEASWDRRNVPHAIASARRSEPSNPIGESLMQ